MTIFTKEVAYSVNVHEFSNIFDKLDQPVIAVSDGTVVYCNPSAKMQLGDFESCPLPEFIIDGETALINGRAYSISSTVAFDHDIYYFSAKLDAENILYHASARLKEKIGELKLADNILSPMIENMGDEKLISCSNRISKNITILHRMAGNLGYFQSFDKIAFAPETFDLGRTISDIADSVPVFVGVACPEIIFKCDGGDMTVKADKNKIELALYQLLSNSLKHTPKDGKITFTLSRTANSFIITVNDTGSGMSSAQLTSAWTPGNVEITPNGGVGIGLPIVQSIASLHGGNAIISSNEHGTTVSVSIPTTQNIPDNLGIAAVSYDSGLSDLMLQLSEVIPADHFCGKFMD